MNQMTGRSIRVLFLLLAVVGVLAWTAPARAQGTMNQLPDPMNSKELTLFLERFVDPTFEQWIAIENAQDVYYKEFALLRDGPIAAFLDETRGFMGGGMPSVEQVRYYLDLYEEVNNRIRRQDGAFFDSITAVLREDQISGLARARLARERIRLRSGVTGQMGVGMSLDLWQAVEKAELEEDQLALIDIELREYEQRLTKQLRKWSDQSGRTMLTMIEEMEVRGYAGLDMSDPSSIDRELMQEVMRAVQESMKVAMERTAEVAAKCRELNVRALSGFAGLLDARAAWKLKRAYLSDASMLGYGMALGWTGERGLGNVKIDVVRSVERLLKEDRVPEEAREQLAELLQVYLAEDSTKIDRALKISKSIDPMLVMMESWSGAVGDDEAEGERTGLAKRVEELQEALVQRKKVADEMRAAVMAIIKELDDERVLTIASGMTIKDDVEDDIDAADAGEQQEFTPQARPWIVTAIDVRDLGRIRRFIGCEEWQHVILESLHEDYLARWAETVFPINQEIAEKEGEAYAHVAQEEDSEKDMKVIKEMQELRRRGIFAARELDELFFENLDLAMSDEATEAIRVLELERLYQHSMGGTSVGSRFAMMWGQDPHTENSIRVLTDMDLSAEEQAAVMTALLVDSEKFLDSASAVFEQRFKNACRLEEVSAQMRVRNGEFRRERWEAIRKLRAENRDLIKPLNEYAEEQRERMFERLSAAISSDSFQKFKKSWREKSHPDIYRDASNVLPVLQRARRLETVSQEQIARILTVEVEFEIAWEDLCARMVEISAAHKGLQDFQDPEMRDAITDRMTRLERIRFQREELATRTLRRLARLLEPEQRARIRVLRDLGEELGEPASTASSSVSVQ